MLVSMDLFFRRIIIYYSGVFCKREYAGFRPVRHSPSSPEMGLDTPPCAAMYSSKLANFCAGTRRLMSRRPASSSSGRAAGFARRAFFGCRATRGSFTGASARAGFGFSALRRGARVSFAPFSPALGAEGLSAAFWAGAFSLLAGRCSFASGEASCAARCAAAWDAERWRRRRGGGASSALRPRTLPWFASFPLPCLTLLDGAVFRKKPRPFCAPHLEGEDAMCYNDGCEPSANDPRTVCFLLLYHK